MTLTYVPLITREKARSLAIAYAAAMNLDAYDSDDPNIVFLGIYWRKHLLKLQAELAVEVAKASTLAESIDILEAKFARLERAKTAADLDIPPAPERGAPSLTLVKA